MITLVFAELLIFVPPRLMVKLADNPTHRSENRLLKKGEKPAMTASSAGHPRWTDEMLDELADSVSELRGSVADLRDSMDGVRLTANALLQIAAQQQRNMDEVRQREGRKTSHDKTGWGTDEMDR
jgi:outer membrane murein-binding lipoprotein Lpp